MTQIAMPCLEAKLVARDKIQANNYNPNHVPRDKMELLKQSIIDNGFCFPIVTIWSEEDEKYIIIDGFHRFTMCQPEWLDIDPVPVVVLQHDISQRMAATIQFNKARGVHEIDGDADIVKSLVKQGMSDADICQHLGIDAETELRYKQLTGILDLFKNVDYSVSWSSDGNNGGAKRKEWDYGGYAAKYGVEPGKDMQVGTGVVRCCDLTKELPEFMRSAQVVFVDPPCSQGNLKSFYTKAGVRLENQFSFFLPKLFECIQKIAPRVCFVEAFASNIDDVKTFISTEFRYMAVIQSHYYHNRRNKCWIVVGVNDEPEGWEDWCMSVHDMDEQSIIREICSAIMPKSTIGDLCMGRGLVGYYANKYGRPFVGTELNPNRLAVLFHRIETGKL